MVDATNLRRAAVPWRARLNGTIGLLITPLREPFAAAGTAIYAVFVIIALLADVMAPYDPLEILFRPDGNLARSEPVGWQHLLGTTNLGRDIFSQLVIG